MKKKSNNCQSKEDGICRLPIGTCTQCEESTACMYCGKSVKQPEKGPKKKFCDGKCRKNYWVASNAKSKVTLVEETPGQWLDEEGQEWIRRDVVKLVVPQKPVKKFSGPSGMNVPEVTNRPKAGKQSPNTDYLKRRQQMKVSGK